MAQVRVNVQNARLNTVNYSDKMEVNEVPWHELENDFGCSICLSVLVLPVSFHPCSHMVCTDCAETLLVHKDHVSLKCPLCRQKVKRISLAEIGDIIYREVFRQPVCPQRIDWIEKYTSLRRRVTGGIRRFLLCGLRRQCLPFPEWHIGELKEGDVLSLESTPSPHPFDDDDEIHIDLWTLTSGAVLGFTAGIPPLSLLVGASPACSSLVIQTR